MLTACWRIHSYMYIINYTSYAVHPVILHINYCYNVRLLYTDGSCIIYVCNYLCVCYNYYSLSLYLQFQVMKQKNQVSYVYVHELLYSTNKSLPANYLGMCSINCMMVSISMGSPHRSQPLRRDMISLAFMHIHMCHAHPHSILSQLYLYRYLLAIHTT